MTLDIIVPHYDEPWEDGRKLFDMLALQRDIDFSEFRVILVNDGEDHDVFPQIASQGYPYEVVGKVIPHGGVSAARNAGLEMATAKWVMFCDFDDTFTSIYSLRGYFDVTGTNDYDLLWRPFYVEINKSHVRQIQHKFNWLFIHTKLFRRSFLEEHRIRFCEGLEYSEDTAFCEVVNMEIDPHRIGEIKNEVYPYVWTFRVGSATTSKDRIFANAVGLFHRQRYVADEYRKRENEERARAFEARAMCDAYVTLCRTDLDANRDAFAEEVAAYYRGCREDLKAVSVETLETAMRGAMREAGITQEKLRTTFDEWAAQMAG